MAFYPERVMFITGGILNVVHAQSEISHRLHELHIRDHVSALLASSALLKLPPFIALFDVRRLKRL